MTQSTSVNFKSLAASILAAVSVSAAGMAPPTPMADAVVDLPEFVVTDTRILPKPESWRYAEIPGFEILSKVSERETRRFVRDFQLLQQVIEMVWPVLSHQTPTVPTMVVLCGRGAVFDSFVPVADSEKKGYITSLFLRDHERGAIVVDFVSQKLSAEHLPDIGIAPLNAGGETGGAGATADSGETAGSALSIFDEPEFMTENDPYREFYLHYFRSLIQRTAPHSPPWLEEGLVHLLATVDYSKKHVTFGRIGNGFGGLGPSNFTAQLGRRSLAKFDLLFAAERPTHREAPQYSMQSFAFVHLCLYGMNQRYQKPFLQLVQRAVTEPITEQVFKECFGMNYKEMLLVMRGYIQHTNHRVAEYRPKKGSAGFHDSGEFVLREATQPEVGRIKGETYRLGGHIERAKDELIAPYIRGERDPALLAALGLYECSLSHDERARKFLEAAAKAKAVRPQAYLELARLRRAEATAAPAGPDGKMSSEQVRAVLEPLRTALSQPPPIFEVYDMMIDIWTVAGTPLEKEDLAVVYEGVNRFPQQLRYLYLAAALSIKNGAFAGANALIERGLKVTPNEAGRRRFEELKAMLPAQESRTTTR